MIKKPKAKKVNKQQRILSRLKFYFETFSFRPSDWLILTLVVLVIECLLLLGNSNVWSGLINTSSFEGLFYSPPIPTLLVLVFSAIFIYKAIMRRRLNKYAIAIAVLLSIVGFLFLFGITPSGQRCTGLFGVLQDCSEIYRFQIYVLFLNPFSLIAGSFLAFTATLALLMQKNTNIKKS